MNLGELRTLARAYVPLAKIRTVTNTTLDLILNQGAVDVAAESICLKANEKFNVVEDQTDYDLSSVVTRYLIVDRPGLWYRDSSSDDYKRLYPKTEKWLDINRVGWRDEDPSEPVYYYIASNTLRLVPAGDGDVSDGLWLYFGQKPAFMTDAAHYPFGGTSEIESLSILSEPILYYWKWKARYIFNEGVDNYRLGENEYKRELARKIKMIYRRPDLTADSKAKRQGRKP